MNNTIEVTEQGALLSYRFADLMLYHGGGSPGGVALGFKALQRVLPLLAPDNPVPRRQIWIRTAFGGPGARDAFEMVTRAATDNRYVVDDAIAQPDLGPTRELFVFELRYQARSLRAVLREGYVSAELVAEMHRTQRSAAEEAFFTGLKQDLADRVLASSAAEVYDVR